MVKSRRLETEVGHVVRFSDGRDRRRGIGELEVEGRRGQRRKGAALTELTIMLPLLSFILVASADFARAFHDFVTITDCARSGSLFGGQNASLSASAYQSGIQSAALADAGGMGTTPTVSTATGTLGTQNNYIDVTVSNSFSTINPYPGIPAQITLSRTIRMRVQPTSYRMK